VREVCTDDIWNGSSCNVFESDQYAYNLGETGLVLMHPQM